MIHGRTERLAALVAVGAIALSACGETPDQAAGDGELVPGVTMATNDVPDDGIEQLTVLTVNAPGSVAPEADRAGSAPDPMSDPVGGFRVVSPDDVSVIDEPPAGLVPVDPADERERAALFASGEGSFIAVDVHGIVGPVDARYVRTLDALISIELFDVPTDDLADTVDERLPDGDDVEFHLFDDAPAASGDQPTVPTTPRAPDSEDPADDDGGTVVVVGDAAIADAITEIAGVRGAQVVGPGVISVDADDAEVVDEIAAVDGVAGVDAEVQFFLSDDAYESYQWALHNTGAPVNGRPGVAGADIGAHRAWDVTTGSGALVAVVDDGFDLDHPDLAATWYRNPAEVCGNGQDDDANGYVDDCLGWDFADGDSDPSEIVNSSNSHGSHVAGIIGADRNGTGTVGALPDVAMLPLKVGYDNRNLSSAGIVAAIYYAVDAGADVINLSLGTSPGVPRYAMSGTESAIRYARDHGVAVVAASGNDGANLDASGLTWPAGFAAYYDNVLAVGATTNTDARAGFSNYGSVVGLYAPGDTVLSAFSGGRWGWMSGTSMATPYAAAGVAGVLAAGQADEPAAAIDLLQQTADGAFARMDLGSAVNYVPPIAVDVSVSGADQLVPDQPGELRWDVTSNRTGEANAIQVSVAARDDVGIGAVEGLTVDVTDDQGVTRVLTTGSDGRFPPIPLDGAASDPIDAGLLASMSLPTADYAFVVELIDSSGLAVAPAKVTYLSVGAPTEPGDGSARGGDGGATTTTLPSDGSDPGTPPAPSTTVAPPTSPPDGGDGATPTTTPPTPTTAPPTTAPGPTAPTTTSPAAPTEPPTGTQPPSSPTTLPGGSTTPTPTPTTLPTVTTTLAPPPGAVPTTSTSTSTSVPSGGPSTTAPTPITTAPTPTTAPPGPAPDPDADGAYRLDSITPRSGSIDGYDPYVLSGSFPTDVPVYVWFGDQASSSRRVSATPTELFGVTPPMASMGVRDVIVRFQTDRAHELRLEAAWTFTESEWSGGPGVTTTTLAPPTSGPTGPSNPGATTTTTTATTTTLPGATPTTAPTGPGPTPTTAPTGPGPSPTTAPPSSSSTTMPPAPTTTLDPGSSPPPTSPSPTTTVPTDWTRPLGGLNLRPTTGTLSTLRADRWPATGCREATCAATTLT